MVKMTICSSFVVTISMLVLFFGTANLTIVLETNGYSNIVVAISEDIPRPSDGGTSVINDLKELLTETSAVLFEATNNRVYFKDIAILVPSTWINDAAPVEVTSKISYQQADIRLTDEPVNSASGSLPYTLHSGKCGVAGNFITFPRDYLEDLTTNLKAQAKGLVQQWAQLRYGVFEEHGYPNDELLPYFYRHPDGYDAVTSSNDTEIKGNLEKLSGGNCEVNANGIISDQGNCRFVPTTTDQTATTSLMSFHWLDTVIGFSDKDKHDRRPPHRQNRLCNSRSSSEVMANLPDFSSVTPSPGLVTIPTFRVFQNMMLPVVYVAMDTSMPSNTNNTNSQAQNILKRGLNNLFFLLGGYPEVLVAWSTFENIDSGPENSYLKEELPPKRIADGSAELTEKVNGFVVSSNVQSRDVSAVIRDGESRLRQYKDVGGSILYVITSTGSVTNDTVIETEMAERLMRNNIKLVVAETGYDTSKALARFAVLSQGGYYFRSTWDSTFFTPINVEIENNCKTGLKTERRIVTSQTDSISASKPWTGFFSIDETLGRNTTLALSLPKDGSFAVTLTSPTGEVLALPNEPEVTNWNYVDSTVRVIWQKIANTAVVGRWSYQVVYDDTSCTLCETEPEIHLQIASSIRSTTSPSLPIFKPWISLTAGFGFVDLSEHPAVIQARFEYAGSHLGGLTVTAEMVLDSVVKASVPLFDTGLIDPDISKDGIYSGIFYPAMNGNYKVNLYAEQSTSVKRSHRILSPDQSSYCCGSSLPTTTLNYFQITTIEAITFEVRNAGSSGTLPQESLPTVSDIQSYTYGTDNNRVYTELKWTVPPNTKSQVVKYSEDYEQLLSNFDMAPESTIEYGSIDEVGAGTTIAVYASAPYTTGKSVYFLVQTTGMNDKKSRSHIVWTESSPPENEFTPPGSSTEALSTTTQTSTNSSTSSVTSTTESTSTSSSTVTSTSTTDSSSVSSTTESSSTTDGSSTTTLTPLTSTDSTPTEATTSTVSSSGSSTDSTSSTSTTPLSTSTTVTSTSTTLSSTSTTGSSTSTTDSSTSTAISSTSTTPSSTSTTASSTSTTLSSTSTTPSSTSTAISSTSTTPSSTSTTASLTSTTLSSTSTTPSSTSTSTSTPSSTTTVSSTADSTTTDSSTATTPDSSTATTPTTAAVSTVTSDPSNSTTSSTSSEATSSTGHTSSTEDSTSSPSSTTDTATTDTSTMSSSTTEDPGDGDGDGLTPAEIGYIIGGVVGAIVVTGAIIGGVMFYKKRHGGGGNSLPPSTSYNGRSAESGAPSGPSGYSNSTYPPSTSYISPTGQANNGRQIESIDKISLNNDNIGITFEDEDMCMTAM